MSVNSTINKNSHRSVLDSRRQVNDQNCKAKEIKEGTLVSKQTLVIRYNVGCHTNTKDKVNIQNFQINPGYMTGILVAIYEVPMVSTFVVR
jgi:hypothetical protein